MKAANILICISTIMLEEEATFALSPSASLDNLKYSV